MAELSEKELSAINDCLKEEELLVKNLKCLQSTRKMTK